MTMKNFNKQSHSITYSWDFTQGYSSLADWTVKQWWFNLDTIWIYWNTNGANVIINDNVDISSATHIILKMRFKSTNIYSWAGTAQLGFSPNPWSSSARLFRIYNWLMTNNWYKCRFYDMAWTDVSLWDPNWTTNVWYMWVIEVNISGTNASWTYKIYQDNDSWTLLYTYNISWNISWAINPMLITEKTLPYISNAELILS